MLDFHYWARDRTLDAVEPLTSEQFTRDMGSSFRSIRDTLAHLYFAEWGWYSRWHGQSPTAWPSAERFPDVASLRAAWKEHETQMRALVEEVGEANLGRAFEYRLIDGTPGKTPFWQMVQHMVNHGTYHRGQVTTMLRQLGMPPGKSKDLITFYRERRDGQSEARASA
jgi:uncharacterized damage-inducible protein DinB